MNASVQFKIFPKNHVYLSFIISFEVKISTEMNADVIQNIASRVKSFFVEIKAIFDFRPYFSYFQKISADSHSNKLWAKTLTNRSILWLDPRSQGVIITYFIKYKNLNSKKS